MSPDTFEHLLSLVGPLITKKPTNMRARISAEERLTLTLHYLAYGSSQQEVYHFLTVLPNQLYLV